jgi:hypothetical protein
MNRFLILILSFFLLSSLNLANCNNLKRDNILKTIQQIHKNLQNEQSKTNVPFRSIPLIWEEEKGLYKSYIHVNFVDNSNSLFSSLIRNNIKVLDLNNFVTSFVLMNLLEVNELSGIELDQTSFKNGLEALLSFRDKNYSPKIPVYTFWREIFSQEKGIWSQYSGNMNKVVDLLPTFSNGFLKTLNMLGLKSLSDIFKTYNGLREGFLHAYRIPPDTDDTSVNLGLTARLNNFPNLRNITENWTDSNSNFTELFDIFKRYAYRPFLNETKKSRNISQTADVIDTRSYFVLHGFISEHAQKSRNLNKTPSLILPATWILDIEGHKNRAPFMIMPFAVNNVDHNVAINFIFGITNFLLFHRNRTEINLLFDQEMEQMYSNTIDLIIYAIRKDTVNTRPDLTLIYYPSVYDFYWLVTRVYSLINTNIGKINENGLEFLFDIREKLKEVLSNEATNQLYGKAIELENDQIYFQEFLGNSGNYTRGEDRLFSTGLAFNSLLNIWTNKYPSNNTFYYLENTPERVKTIITKSVNFVMKNINKYFISLENTFFSGSVKTLDTFPFFYPGNYFKYLNGTDIPNTDNTSYISADLIAGTKVMSPEEFESNLNKTFFGRKPPQKFIGFNSQPFPYWSSPAMTYSINLIGLTKYINLK